MAFPANPSDKDRWFRTDLGMDCYYDLAGSRWLTVQEFPVGFTTEAAQPISVSGSLLGRTGLRSDYGALLTRFNLTYLVATTNNGSNYWTAALNDSSNATITTANTASGSPGTHGRTDIALNYAYSGVMTYVSVAKTGTPGTLNAQCVLYYRLVVT